MLASSSLNGSSNYATAQDLEAKKILDGIFCCGGDAMMEDIYKRVRAGLLDPFNITEDRNGAKAWHSRNTNIEMMIDPTLQQA